MSLLLCYFPVIFLIKFNCRFYYYICYYHHTLSVACRGCWMPGANEVLGCPRIFSIRLPKFLTTFFSHLPKFFTFLHQFSHSLLGCLPVLHRALVMTVSSSLFSHLPTFVYENWPLGCPLRWMPGAVAPSTPTLCTPLHPSSYSS